MKLELTPNYARVLEATDEQWDWIRDYLSIKEQQFRKNYRTGRAEHAGAEKISFVKRDGSFPAGFVRSVAANCKQKEWGLEYVNLLPEPSTPPDDTADISFLRPYQLEAVEMVVKRRRGVIQHPTAAGKTIVFVGMSMRIPIHWVFLVRQKDLLYQTAEKYERHAGKTVNLIGDGKVDLSGTGNVTVATAQTLSAKRGDPIIWDHLSDAEGVVVDECHTVPGDQLYRFIMVTSQAIYRVGLSGTPFARSDTKGALTIGALGPIIHKRRADELIAQGYLAEAIIEMHEHHGESAAATQPGAYNELVVRSVSRNKLIVKLMQRADKPNLTFVKQVKHGHQLVARAEKAGLKVEFVWGNKNTDSRKASIKRLVRGDIDCIVASVVFEQGIDIEDLASGVNAAAGKSARAALQRLGRGMRRPDGKTSFQMFDVYDRGNKWMEKHARSRQRAYESEGHKVTVVAPEELTPK